MIDLPKSNNHIKFVSSLKEIKKRPAETEESGVDVAVDCNVNSKMNQQIKQLQSENK
jgi:hypothetical protein